MADYPTNHQDDIAAAENIPVGAIVELDLDLIEGSPLDVEIIEHITSGRYTVAIPDGAGFCSANMRIHPDGSGRLWVADDFGLPIIDWQVR